MVQRSATGRLRTGAGCRTPLAWQSPGARGRVARSHPRPLAAGWSPEQVFRRLRREVGQPVISHETIYRFVHAQLKAPTTGAGATICHAPSTSAAGGPKGAGRARPAGRSTSDPARSPPLRGRALEADAMLFSRPGHAVIVAHERTSRLTIAVRQDSLKAGPVARALVTMLHSVPPALRRSSPRQRHRVRTPSTHRPAARAGHLVLRSSIALAERRVENASVA